jgi:FtsP/CotA-like multicopper oxidase with cupredoxin domain
MNYTKFFRQLKLPALALAALALAATPSFAVELAAVPAEWLPPGGTVGVDEIPMWAFVDASPDANAYVCPGSPVEWAVGPALTATAGGSLTVNVKNCLADPVSVFIPGQLKATSPVTFTDDQARSRVRSFDAETAPAAVGTYTWNGVKEGTYLYHSGTHPQVQVQMGLYGALVVTGASYPAVAQEEVLVYSEIDPALHDAVADLTYGTAAYPSTFDYMPRYFLINGKAYPDTADVAVTTGDVLLRFVNAGLKTHVPTLEGGLYMSLIAEDGNLYPFPIEQYGVELQAAKTIDAVVTVEAAGRFALYDRSLLGLTNWLDTGGGMLTYLNAGAGAGLLELSASTYSVAENGVTLTVTVNRVGGSTGAVSVNYATADGSATDGVDYTGTLLTGAVTLNFADTANTATFDIPIADNGDYEGDKTFSVALSSATGGATLGAPASAVVTITEDDPVPPAPGALQLSASTYSVAESGVTLTVTVNRVGGSAGAVSVDYATADGTATAGADYAGIATTTLNFADSQTTATFPISILDDVDVEGDETFSVTLSNVTGGATLGTPPIAMVTIIDDEAPNVAPIANDDSTSMPKNTTLVYNIVANDLDPDCGTGPPCIDPTSVVITTGSTTQRGGTVVNNGDGTITYTPKNAGFRGTDLFQYTVEDDPNSIPGDHDGLPSNVATVRINVLR